MLLPQHAAARTEPFGYICRSCSQCCPRKYIRVNPYEVARMARFLQISTTQFRDFYTEQNGAILKRNDSDTCVFLGDGGCGIYPERPLVCRLYPLGRQVAADGTEEWEHADRPAQSQGTCTSDGTIADWVASQGAQPFLDAADAYADWVRTAYNAMYQDSDHASRTELAANLLDMDIAIAIYCSSRQIEEPTDLEERLKMHLRLLYLTLGGEHPR